jgi:hypothetical protein
LQDNLNVQLFVATDEARESQKPSETLKPGCQIQEIFFRPNAVATLSLTGIAKG